MMHPVKNAYAAYILNALRDSAVRYMDTANDVAKSAAREIEYLKGSLQPRGFSHQLLAEAQTHYAAYIANVDHATPGLLAAGLDHDEIHELIALAVDVNAGHVYFAGKDE